MASTDARSGVRLDAALEPKDWGTQVQFAVSNIKGPLTCRLVAVRTDGGSEVLSTWTVGEKGWGTAGCQEPLLLPAVTALPRADIAHLQVQSVAANGSTETLVTAPVMVPLKKARTRIAPGLVHSEHGSFTLATLMRTPAQYVPSPVRFNQKTWKLIGPIVQPHRPRSAYYSPETQMRHRCWRAPVVPEKRKLMVVGAAIAAALALPGCAPAGYNAADYGGGRGRPGGQRGGGDAHRRTRRRPEPTAAGEAKAPKLSEDDITSELTGTTVKRMGKVVVDQDGWVLYRFDDDKSSPRSSRTATATARRSGRRRSPRTASRSSRASTRTDVGTVTRADGTKQLTIGNWPVYRYAGDKKPGSGSARTSAASGS